MNCPSCKEQKLVISERKGIEIDYCPECRGVWLDRGELDKILERSREEESTSSPRREPEPQLRERDFDDRKYEERKYYEKHHYKRKKSFLEDLFD